MEGQHKCVDKMLSKEIMANSAYIPPQTFHALYGALPFSQICFHLENIQFQCVSEQCITGKSEISRKLTIIQMHVFTKFSVLAKYIIKHNAIEN